MPVRESERSNKKLKLQLSDGHKYLILKLDDNISSLAGKQPTESQSPSKEISYI